MIRHCVFARFRNDVTDDQRAGDPCRSRSIATADRRHGQGRIHANTSPEPFARGFTHGFTIDFRDAAACDAYLMHEAHSRAGARLVAALEGGTDGLMVSDLDISA
ncbi:MAG: Dabb family protein [Mesorhizobium sp.]|uniref:Dabb family protein n=1 Tax=unclassified Mesorhizobium TaxID=325217 RepID=UPI000FCA04FF|nr:MULTISPECIES: Dabb family protein [unclassified Mesorhizobium]RUV71266.1 Dabb family protein [Mesorhizobium sp. M5C.F.Cr.IN.023.01.1.1]RWF82662.1 MAG: Dabb family protein [Mesorhizobium sp.]RWF94260.1 MAG: Dabb family protein [Mesorhizobium sp.]RWI33261.1 MAG: Dabb family protein [Mesorhizobium sp.]RWI42971.1 MAG: Dabb family protein [Mesorhizobium sp.]